MTTSSIAVQFAEAASITLSGSIEVGDLLIAGAARLSSTTVPTVPAGWTWLLMSRNATSRAVIYAAKIATSGDIGGSSGTWTNAEFLSIGAWRDSVNYLIPGQIATAAQTGGTSMSFPALDAVNTSRQRASSWVAAFAGVSLNSINGESAPTGMTNRGSLAGASVGEYAIHDSNGDTTWSSAQIITLSSAAASQTLVIELLDSGIAKASGSGSGRNTLINNPTLVRGLAVL